MDDRQLEAYLNLIQLLLNCPSGEEAQILQANSELVDAGLVQVMQLYAENQREEGNQNTADFLTNLASYIVEVSESPSANSQLEFLLQVFQVTAETQGDPNIIYPLLWDNINLINDNLAVVLQNWVRETLPNLDSQERISIIAVVVTFSIAIWQLPLGSRASNLEIAIAGYEIALTVFTRQENAENWATTQNNLAVAYSYRIIGQKADNLEMAISAYQAALSVRTREAFPEYWADTQNNLAIAYSDRIRGEKADNLEIAISAFEKALEVYTREAFPENWAQTQNNLATAYLYRIIGEKADNLEMAISAFEAALEVHTREAFPQDWAATQSNLAIAYSYRIRGKKVDNLEMAISACQATLSVYTREAFPISNASTLYSLGCAYWDNSQLPEAYNSFNTAIETVESMRSEIIIGGETDRQKLAEEYNRIYQGMVEVCLEMKNKNAALEYIERTKTRNLVELFHNARSLPQNVQRISFQEIRSLLGEDESILEWYITFNGFKVFIITRNSTQPVVGHSSHQDLEALEKFQQEYIDDYINQPDNWRNQLETRLEKLAKILHIDQIISRLPKNCQRLILVPFRYWHLLPLHALTSRRLKQNIEKTGCLLDLFPGGVRYTPSCHLLQLSQRVNPTGEESSPTRLF